jgi:transposase
MRKNSTGKRAKGKRVHKEEGLTIGIDLGDRKSRVCVLGEGGSVVAEGEVATTRRGLWEKFEGLGRCRMAIEVGTHSPWVSRLLTKLGHEVIVANARQVRLISASSRKDDRLDARMLARLARMDPVLLHPIRHRSEQAQAHLTVIRVREALLEARTKLINTARGLTKATGERLAGCDADALCLAVAQELPEELRKTLQPLLETVESLTEKIKQQDTTLEQIARNEYPETKLLTQVYGVGTLIALTFVLTLEDRERFQKSRDVGCYVGLRPRRSASGERQPQLGISKEGDRYLRKLLVQGAHCILSRRAPDTDLKRWGLALAEGGGQEAKKRGGKNAKKRAIVAVARKLGILLHRLWVTGEVYEPLRHCRAAA